MKKIYPLLTIALVLFACQKEPIEISHSPTGMKLTPQQRLDKLSPPLILFQYSLVDLESGEESGWIIDRSGNVKTYHSVFSRDIRSASENESWEEADLADLYAIATEEVAAIEIEELLARAHQGLGLSKRFLSGTEIDADASWVAGFYAFTQHDSYPYRQNSLACNESPKYITPNDGNTEIQRLIVNISGHYNRYETSNYATDLHHWFWTLNERL